MKKIIYFLAVIGIIFLGYRFLSTNSTNTNFPTDYLDDRDKFTQSIQVLRESSDLTQPTDNSGKPFDIPKEQEQQIYSKMEEGIKLSGEISDEFLDYLDPQLKSYYRNKLIKGTEIYYDGVKANNSGDIAVGVQKQMEGNNLIIEWINWWESNNKRIADKAFPD